MKENRAMVKKKRQAIYSNEGFKRLKITKHRKRHREHSPKTRYIKQLYAKSTLKRYAAKNPISSQFHLTEMIGFDSVSYTSILAKRILMFLWEGTTHKGSHFPGSIWGGL